MDKIRFSLNEAESVSVKGQFDEDSSIFMSKLFFERLKNNESDLSVFKMGGGNKPCIKIEIDDFIGKVKILAGSNGIVKLGCCGQVNLDLRIGYDSKIVIGDKTTANNVKIISINSDILIGEDCMFSDGILLQGFDQHGIVDLGTGEIINNTRGFIKIENHVSN